MEPYFLVLLAGLRTAAVEGGRRLASWAVGRFFKDAGHRPDPSAPGAEPSTGTPAGLNVLRLASELRNMRDGEGGES